MKPNVLWASGALIAIPLAAAAMIGTVQAATLSLDAFQKYDAPMSPPSNLTTEGSLDWAYWASNVGTVVPGPVAPTNDKSGGTIISSLSVVGSGSGLRGSTSADANGRYTWTDGTSPVSGSNVNLSGGLVFSNTLGQNGQGFSFTLQGNPLTPYYVVLHAGGFAATGTLTLFLNGVQMVSDSSLVFANIGPKQVAAYQILFQPDNLTDVLTVQFTSSSVLDTSFSHVGIEAVTVGLTSVIPEPSVALLGGLGSLLVFRRRKAC